MWFSPPPLQEDSSVEERLHQAEGRGDKICSQGRGFPLGRGEDTFKSLINIIGQVGEESEVDALVSHDAGDREVGCS